VCVCVCVCVCLCVCVVVSLRVCVMGGGERERRKDSCCCHPPAVNSQTLRKVHATADPEVGLSLLKRPSTPPSSGRAVCHRSTCGCSIAGPLPADGSSAVPGEGTRGHARRVETRSVAAAYCAQCSASRGALSEDVSDERK
jgi:hypothetical protein